MSLIRKTAGIWGPIGFCGAAAVAARHQPGYAHISHHVSGLAARGERSARVMIPGFLVLGISSLLMPAPNVALARMARVAGTTAIAAGLIQVSEPRCPQPGHDPSATSSDVGHGLASIATFVLWTAMPFVARRHSGPSWYRLFNGVLGVATLAALVAAGSTARAESSHKGLVQRAFLGVVFAWHVATAIVTITKPARLIGSNADPGCS
ncbi:MAG: DUF998 domain-containing protein [Acidimicrobiia bacterium]|nr:DUF998 domain-containing protein [Acidimicrobiia bacterium]